MVNEAKRAFKRSLQRLSDEEIERILEEHLKWTRSKGKEGEFADLTGKNLFGANLKGAYLAQAILQDTQLMAANFEGANLVAANLKGAFLGEAVFKNANLQGSQLQGAYLVEADLERADLDGANLSGTYLTKANVKGAKLRGANFENADVTQIKYNRFGRYQGIRVANCHGCARFKRLAQDQGYLEELRNSDWIRKSIYILWLIFADCGRSLILWAVWSVSFAIFFGFKFFSLGAESFDVTQLPWNKATTIYYSVVTFTAFGFGDIVPKTNEAAWWVMAEVIVGYIMLGGLISIFATKIARRS